MLKSIFPFWLKYPTDPVYADLGICSSSLIICIQRTLGQPVIVPPGKRALTISLTPTFFLSLPLIFDTI